MEEDIKILEERITMLKRHIKYYEESDCKTDIYYQLVKECKALETLIKGYRELKENCKTCVVRDDLHSYIEETEKQDKMIDEMVEIISNVTVPQEKCKECIKEYFKKKVEDK